MKIRVFCVHLWIVGGVPFDLFTLVTIYGKDNCTC